MSFFCNSLKPSIDIQDNRMVLSLPDAMTPVVWMIDLKESGTFVMRVEKDENGLYILQKIEGTGKSVKIEDIAYYADQSKAVTAMTVLTKSGAGKSCNTSKSCFSSNKFTRFALSLVKMVLLIALSLFVILFILAQFITPAAQNIGQQDIGTQQQEQSAPLVSNDPEAVGVPLSADDYLQKRSNIGLPF